MSIAQAMVRQMREGTRLVSITLAGTMQATLWQDLYGDPDESAFDMEFSKDFILGEAGPWAVAWDGIRESLIEAISSGDLVGQMGTIVDASITFHYAGAGRTFTSTRSLPPTKATKDLYLN
jgi:hypothetical protein